jgi:hypothetical protein
MSFFDVASEILAGLCSLGMLAGLVALALWLRRSRDQTHASFAAMAAARGLSLTTPHGLDRDALGKLDRAEASVDVGRQRSAQHRADDARDPEREHDVPTTASSADERAGRGARS